jgi:hypothetical protein
MGVGKLEHWSMVILGAGNDGVRLSAADRPAHGLHVLVIVHDTLSSAFPLH